MKLKQNVSQTEQLNVTMSQLHQQRLNLIMSDKKWGLKHFNGALTLMVWLFYYHLHNECATLDYIQKQNVLKVIFFSLCVS